MEPNMEVNIGADAVYPAPTNIKSLIEHGELIAYKPRYATKPVLATVMEKIEIVRLEDNAVFKECELQDQFDPRKFEQGYNPEEYEIRTRKLLKIHGDVIDDSDIVHRKKGDTIDRYNALELYLVRVRVEHPDSLKIFSRRDSGDLA
ncbi:hypothetical protein ACFLZX_02440 [Nanoarchaeota archaeon]